MRLVRGKHTRPEIAVRRLAHKMGLRFRLHRRDLPGRPDLVFPKYRVVIFVHGCFWHRHKRCPNTRTPKSRLQFWEEKFESNVQRDRANRLKLRATGWKVLVIWECEVKDSERLQYKIKRFMEKATNAVN